MSQLSRAAAGALARQGPTVLVFASLAALGWWGAVCDWKVSAMVPWLPHRAQAEPKKAAEEAAANPALSPGEVTIDSEDVAAEAGIATALARREGLTRTVTAPGVVAFNMARYARLSPRVSGSTWRLLAEPGQRVRKGDVLALLLAPEAGKARAEFLNSWVQHDVRSRQLDRLLSAGSAIPERTVRDARSALREARVLMINAQRSLANLGLHLPLESLRERSDDQVGRTVQLLGVPPALHDEPGLPADLLPMNAPIDGLVVRRDLVMGGAVGADHVAFVLADLDRLCLMMDVRQEDVDRLAPGQTVTFRSTGTAQTASGALAWISPEVDPKTHTVKARADVYNPGGRLRPATFGQVGVEVGSSRGVTVPDESVQWDGKSRRVFVRRGGTAFEPRLVLTGTRTGRRTELLDPRTLLGAGLQAQAGLPGGPLGVLGLAAAGVEVLVPVRPGDSVATTGSQALKSEMQKALIGGGE